MRNVPSLHREKSLAITVSEETVEVVSSVSHKRAQQRTAGQRVELPFPQILEATVEVVRLVPRESVQQPSVQEVEENVDVVRLVPHKRVQQRTAGQIEDAPQSPAEVVEAVTFVPREQAQKRIFLSNQEEQLLHSLRNLGRERAMRSLPKLREKHDPPAWLWEGFAPLDHKKTVQLVTQQRAREALNVQRALARFALLQQQGEFLTATHQYEAVAM